MAFEDYTKTTQDLIGTGQVKVFVNGSSVSDILILEQITKDGDSNAFEVADKSSAEGIVTGYTLKKNGDGDKNIVASITLKEIDGTEVEYEAADESLAVPDTHTYAELSLDKNTGEIVAITSNTWSYIGTLDGANNAYEKLTQIIADDDQKIEADKTALVVKRSVSGGKVSYTKTTLSQINVSTKAMTLEVHQEYVNSSDPLDTIIYADFIVVQEYDAIANAKEEAARLNAIDAIETANVAFEALDGTVSAWNTYVAADAAADLAITAYQTAGGTPNPANLTPAYTTFALNATTADTTLAAAKAAFAATDYSAASAIDSIAKVVDLATLSARMTCGDDGIVDATDGCITEVVIATGTALGATTVDVKATFIDGTDKTVTITTDALTTAIDGDSVVYNWAE